jgi:hypothetical protein
MHKKLIEHATHEELKDFTCDFLSMLKATNEKLYEEAEEILYEEIYDCHFCEWLLDFALEEMENEDGTKGKRWSLQQTNDVAKSYNVKFEHFNEFDWCYVMNMAYSDYFTIFGTSTDTYVKFAKAFLFDKDAPRGKAYRYYKALKDL